jgi:hypothetical protein
MQTHAEWSANSNLQNNWNPSAVPGPRNWFCQSILPCRREKNLCFSGTEAFRNSYSKSSYGVKVLGQNSFVGSCYDSKFLTAAKFLQTKFLQFKIFTSCPTITKLSRPKPNIIYRRNFATVGTLHCRNFATVHGTLHRRNCTTVKAFHHMNFAIRKLRIWSACSTMIMGDYTSMAVRIKKQDFAPLFHQDALFQRIFRSLRWLFL